MVGPVSETSDLLARLLAAEVAVMQLSLKLDATLKALASVGIHVDHEYKVLRFTAEGIRFVSDVSGE